MLRSSAVRGILRLSITSRAVSVALRSWWVIMPDAPPQEKEGIKVRGNPDPKMLAATPTTVPVLNMVLIPHLEWSPIVRQQNMRPVSAKPFFG